MENPYYAKCYLLANKVNVEFNMLRAPMLHRVS